MAANVGSQLGELIQSASHCVVYTGAGISTSAQIPDFRGPNGVWTLQDKGRLPESITMEQAMPTSAHMALVELAAKGKIACVVSQNVDGLHKRSGLRTDQLAELHGNCFIETCTVCEAEYERSFDVCEHHGNQAPTKIFHDTGRRCTSLGCSGALRNTIVNFGENLPASELTRAQEHTARADLAIVLGSSCTVTPAADMPARVKKNGGALVIVNHQETPLDHLCDVKTVCDIDDVMGAAMRALGLTIPTFDESAFKASVSEDKYGMEICVGHDESTVYATSHSMDGEDVIHYVDFFHGPDLANKTTIGRAPFRLRIPAGTSVRLEIHLLDQALAVVEHAVDLAAPSGSSWLVR